VDTSKNQGVLFLEDVRGQREALRANWLRDPVPAFEQWRRAGRASNGFSFSEQSIKQHVAMWGAFARYMKEAGRSIDNVEADTIEQFVLQLRGRPLKPDIAQRQGVPQDLETESSLSTRRRYLKLLLQTFEHLKRQGLRRGNPAEPVMQKYGKPEAPPTIEYLSNLHERSLIKYISERKLTDWKDQRDAAILWTLLGTGVTVAELLRLRCVDVDVQDYKPLVKIVNHDLTHGHSSPISPFAVEPIVAWLEWRMNAQNKFQGDWLFPGTFKTKASEELLVPTTPEENEKKQRREMMNNTVGYDIVRVAVDAIGFTGKIRGPQTLRNTFARRQLYNEADPIQLRTWLGLSSDKTIDKLLRTLPGTKNSTVF